MAQSEVCTGSVPRRMQKTEVDWFLKVAPTGGLSSYTSTKSAFGPSQWLSQSLEMWFKQCDCGGIQVIFIFFVFGGIFQISHKEHALSVIWKKKKKSTQGIKNRVVKWVVVCQRNLISFFVSSICANETKWVQWALLIPRDQLSVIANLKANYQQETETVISWNYTWGSPLVGNRGVGSAPTKMHWHTQQEVANYPLQLWARVGYRDCEH